MAFTAANLAAISVSNTNCGSLYQYKETGTTLAVMSGGGYFDDQKVMKDGDIILLIGSDGVSQRIFNVTSGFTTTNSSGDALYSQTQVLVTATTLVPTAAQNGKTFVLQRAAGVAVTLPAPVAGMKYTFVHGGPVLSSVGHVITTNGTLQKIFKGSTVCAGLVELIGGTAHDTITFASGASIIGDKLEIVSDGTYWYVSGIGSVDNAIVGSASA